MIPQARLIPGRGWRPIRAALYYAQRLIVETQCRRTIVRCVAFCINKFHPAMIGPPPQPALSMLLADGCAMVPRLLSDDALTEMLVYLESQPVQLRDGRKISLDAVPAGQALADYSLSSVLNCPHFVDLANHPFLLSLAAAYIGCTPTLSSVGLRWSFPGCSSPEMVQHFHRDPDDWRFLKFFTYLTQVDDTSGPHMFIRGSHRDKCGVFIRPYDEDEIMRRYGATRLVSVLGQRGTMFVADTSGIHKGSVPTAKARLLLEIGYSLLPVFAFNYRPERPTSRCMPVDRYINRLIIAH